MSLSLDDLKQQFKDAENKSGNYQSQLGDWFPFWKADFDSVSTFRFLPDANPNSKYFLLEKLMHRIPVTTENGTTQTRQIPCLSQFGKSCPACKTAQKFYDEDDEKHGSMFYKKKSWVGQGLIIEANFEYENPENSHKKISIGWQIHEAIKTGIMHDVENHPCDLENGYDFRILKSRGAGKNANYSSSRFSPKSSPVNPGILKDIKLYDLRELLPKEPGLENMEAMLTSALTGEIYTRPGSNSSDTPTSAFSVPDRSSPAPSRSSSEDDDDGDETSLPWEESSGETTKTKEAAAPASSGSQPEDAILAAIKNRQKAKTSAE